MILNPMVVINPPLIKTKDGVVIFDNYIKELLIIYYRTFLQKMKLFCITNFFIISKPLNNPPFSWIKERMEVLKDHIDTNLYPDFNPKDIIKAEIDQMREHGIQWCRHCGNEAELLDVVAHHRSV